MDFYETLKLKMLQMNEDQKKEFILLAEQYLQDLESFSSDQE